jgi:hypothetical protein
MPYTVTVIESNVSTDSNTPINRYIQTVDSLDLSRLIQVVNTPVVAEPPKRKKRTDAGKPKTPKALTTGGQP